MSLFLICPDCKRKVEFPESASGKAIRCSACNAQISPTAEALPLASPESFDANTSAASALTVTAILAPLATPVPPLIPLIPEDRRENEQGQWTPEKPIRRKFPIRRVIGGLLLVLTVVAISVGLFGYFVWNRTIPAAD
jgi:hypothetical protein